MLLLPGLKKNPFTLEIVTGENLYVVIFIIRVFFSDFNQRNSFYFFVMTSNYPLLSFCYILLTFQFINSIHF